VPDGSPDPQAAAVRIVGGELFRRLNPQSENERRALLDAGYHLNRVLTTAALAAAGDDIFFAATGI
jgi:fructose-1,6-bisphosphatase II